MLLATFTFGDALLTTLELAFLFLWIWIAVGIVFDIFRSADLSNVAKALWLLFIFMLPLLGVLVYLLVRGHTMHEHQAVDQARLAAFQHFVHSGGASGPARDLTALADLRERGILNDDEFERAKAKVLA
ncbi:MAG TPA: SHOCT domain-containing protein [Gaiellaceae bacterium]|nr:SHOCT domain-containing protein [Gaiellaceae bacterium]